MLPVGQSRIRAILWPKVREIPSGADAARLSVLTLTVCTGREYQNPQLNDSHWIELAIDSRIQELRVGNDVESDVSRLQVTDTIPFCVV